MTTTKQIRESEDLSQLTLERVDDDIGAFMFEHAIEGEADLRLNSALRSARECIRRNDAKGAAEAALQAGALWMAIKNKLDISKGGRPEHPVWGFIRAAYKDHPKWKQVVIIREGQTRYEKATGEKCDARVDYLEKKFKVMVAKKA